MEEERARRVVDTLRARNVFAHVKLPQAGITQYGTDAASDLVTSPDLMAEALRGAPKDWQSKNLQIVLRVKVISGAPTSPKVVQRYFW